MTASRSGGGGHAPATAGSVPALRLGEPLHSSQIDVMCCVAAWGNQA